MSEWREYICDEDGIRDAEEAEQEKYLVGEYLGCAREDIELQIEAEEEAKQ